MNEDFVGQDRREHKRVEVSFAITYTIKKPVSIRMDFRGAEVYALMLDLSEGGMAVITGYEIPHEALLSTKFILINLHFNAEGRTKIIKAAGEVRYSILFEKNDYRLGIRFSQISQEDKDAISNFVKTSKDSHDSLFVRKSSSN